MMRSEFDQDLADSVRQDFTLPTLATPNAWFGGMAVIYAIAILGKNGWSGTGRDGILMTLGK